MFISETSVTILSSTEARIGLSRRASFPEFFPTTAEFGTTKGNDGVGSADGPTHSRLFEAKADDGFATRFDDTGAGGLQD
jgi:hypothetical protein